MMVPSILPPPTPWKLFVFAAGVFEMKILDVYAVGLRGTGDPVFGHCDFDD